jgi:hypothetical protein
MKPAAVHRTQVYHKLFFFGIDTETIPAKEMTLKNTTQEPEPYQGIQKSKTITGIPYAATARFTLILIPTAAVLCDCQSPPSMELFR